MSDEKIKRSRIQMTHAKFGTYTTDWSERNSVIQALEDVEYNILADTRSFTVLARPGNYPNADVYQQLVLITNPKKWHFVIIDEE